MNFLTPLARKNRAPKMAIARKTPVMVAGKKQTSADNEDFATANMMPVDNIETSKITSQVWPTKVSLNNISKFLRRSGPFSKSFLISLTFLIKTLGSNIMSL